MAGSVSSDERLAGRTLLPDRCGAAAALVGLAAGLLLAGLVGRLTALFEPGATPRVVIAGGLLCFALGPLLPDRLARFLARTRGGAAAERLTFRDDQALLWAVLALVALLAGLAVAVLPLWTPLVEAGYRWMEARFLWSDSSRAFVQLLAVVAITLPGGALTGMALGCAARLAGHGRIRCVSTLGWAVIGVGVALVVVRLLGRVDVRADGLCLAAAVPLLLASVSSTQQLGRSPGPAAPRVGLQPRSVPDLRDRYPALIRCTVVWLAASTAVVVVVWPHVASRWCGAVLPGGITTPVLLQVVALGLGMIVCERSGSSRSHSGGGLGVACVAGGMGMFVAAAAPLLWSGARADGLFPWIALMAAGLVCGFLMGFAVAYGHMSVLRRVGHRGAGSAWLFSVTLAAWAVAAFAFVRPITVAERPFVFMAACAVSLVGLGGVTIIHEPGYSLRTRRRRLAAVFASIALMIGVLPIAGRAWTARAANVRQTAHRPGDAAAPREPTEARALRAASVPQRTASLDR